MKEKIYSLNGMKGLLCFIIAFGAHMHFPDTDTGHFFSNQLWFFQRAVEVFCAISGFGMSIGYYDRIHEMRFCEYIKKRIAKLFPLYWMTLTLCLIFQLIYYYFNTATAIGDYSLDLYHTIFAYLGVECGWIIGASPANGPLWTIDCLLLCYVVYYLVVYVTNKDKTKYIVLLSAILLLSLTGIFMEWTIPFLNWDNSLRCLGAFCVGALISEVYRNRKWSMRILLAESASLVYLFILRFILKMNINDAMGNRASISILVFCPLFILLCIHCWPIKKIMETKLMQGLGEISMSLYMWNWVFVLIVFTYFPQMTTKWTSIATYVLMQLLVVSLIHKFIEPKVLPLIQKLFID